SKSRCAAETAKGIQNLVNGNFLVNGEQIQLPGLPFPSHHLWEMMNAKEKRDYNVEVTLHKRQSDGSIFSILKFNHMHFLLHEEDAFLFKENEIEAKLVSDHFKLCHEKLPLRVAFNSKMVGSDDPIIAFQSNYNNQDETVRLFDRDGFEYGEVSDGNILELKNPAKFIGELSSSDSRRFHINSFCSFSLEDQSLLDAFLTRGVLFNFAMDSHIFTLENEAQSFYFFNSYNGPAKDFYVMKKESDEYFAVIKGEKFKIHPPAGIEGNFLVSSNLPFLFVSVEKSFQIIIPVSLPPPGGSYNFTFVKATCKDDHFNIEGHDREIDLAIVYWLVFLRYYDRAMQYVSLYTSVSFKLTELELVILRNILEIKYRDLEYLVIEAWANHLLDENSIFFKGFLNQQDKIKKITYIANLIPVIPFKYKRLLFSFLPDINEDKYLWAYSNKLEIGSSRGKSSKLQPNIPILMETTNDAHYKRSLDLFSKVQPKHWNEFDYFDFPSFLSFINHLAQSSKDLTD
ncbi:hypothetical protein DI09_317p10, partial [Mitosporidium daphniae]